MKRNQVIKEIDDIITLYCNECFLRAHFRKEYSRTYAHQFCIKQCTVGEKLQKKGQYLLK